jgi:hypothetical protein
MNVIEIRQEVIKYLIYSDKKVRMAKQIQLSPDMLIDVINAFRNLVINFEIGYLLKFYDSIKDYKYE